MKKTGDKTATPPWPDPHHTFCIVFQDPESPSSPAKQPAASVDNHLTDSTRSVKFLQILTLCINCFEKNVNMYHIDGLMQDCSISIANALEILQSFTKPLRFCICTSQHSCQLKWYRKWYAPSQLETTSSPIGWAHTQNDPCLWYHSTGANLFLVDGLWLKG